MKKISVIMVDDHELFRLGLQMAIEGAHPDIVIAGEVSSGAALFELLKTVSTDIVLLDVVMPNMNGFEVARRLKANYPEIKILAISAENTSSTIAEMLEIGIEGFISKANSNLNTLANAIRSIMDGFDYYGKDIAEVISRIYVIKKRTTQVSEEFSEQEKRILELCHQGLSAKMIADRLCLSPRTVNWHKSNMFRKLGINSTLELVQFVGRGKDNV